jgi:Na+-driven multidrug efflux pump
MFLQLNANIPRYFIEHYLGERELAFFAAMAYLMLPGNMVLVAALGQAATPRLAKHYAAGETGAFLSLLLRMAAMVALGGGLAALAILIAGKMILTLLYTAEYTQHLDVLFWVTIEAGLGFVCSVLAYAMTAARRFRLQAPLSPATAYLAPPLPWSLPPPSSWSEVSASLSLPSEIATRKPCCRGMSWPKSVVRREGSNAQMAKWTMAK